MIWLLPGGWGKLGTDPLIPPTPFVCRNVGTHISVCPQYWRQMQSPSDSASWNSKPSNFNILNSFHSMYLGFEPRNSTEKPQIALDFILNFVLLLVKGCSWLVKTVTHRKWSSTVTCCDLWRPRDRAQPISLSSSARIWKCMCVYATAVCVHAHAVWTFQPTLPPQASCWWLLTLAEHHIPATRRSMENVAFPRYGVAQCARYVSIKGLSEADNEENKDRWGKSSCAVWVMAYVIFPKKCAIYD